MPWKRWLAHYPIVRLSTGLYVVILAVYAYLARAGVYAWPGILAVLLGIAFLLTLDRLENQYRNRQPAWLLPRAIQLARVAVIAVCSSCDGLGFVPETYVLLMLFFSFFLMSGRSFGLSGVAWLACMVTRVHIVRDSTPDPVWGADSTDVMRHLLISIASWLTLTFIMSIAYQAWRERANRLRVEKLLRELEDSHRQLQAYAAQVAELATMEERSRLARDIHDSLGHYLTVINVQLEKALAFRDRNPPEADEAVRQAKRLAGEALQDVRRSVGVLRSAQERFALVPALTSLVNDTRSDCLSVELKVEGGEDGFPVQSLMALYRAAQEGLTNIHKHAGASQATVRLRFTAEEASLCISDNGRGFDPSALAGTTDVHYGLSGVRERLELIQGTLKVDSAPGKGTRLFITVPGTSMPLPHDVRNRRNDDERVE